MPFDEPRLRLLRLLAGLHARQAKGADGTVIVLFGRQHHLDALNVRRACNPIVAQRAQMRELADDPDPGLHLHGGRNGEARGEIDRAGRDTRADIVGSVNPVTEPGKNILLTRLSNVDAAGAERRSQPFVQREANEIRAYFIDVEGHLADRLRTVENDIHPIGPGHGDNIFDRRDQSVAVRHMGQQQQFRARRFLQYLFVGSHDVGAIVRFGKRKAHDPDAPALLQIVHRILHLVIIDIAIDDRIASLEQSVIDYKRIECLSPAASQRDLVGLGPDHVRDRIARLVQFGVAVRARHGAPQEG